MSSGRILVAEYEGVHAIKLVGDVRLTLCISFDDFIERMFAHKNLQAVVFDLRDAEGIDSTTLGLMAKISIGARDRGLKKPLVVTSSPSIARLLESMGFEDIFELIADGELPFSGEQPLHEVADNENKVKQTVLEAHHILMELNQPNRVKFKELVESLENKG